MANTSRDTFRLTNVLHQLDSGEVVAEPRHYVAVRQQQGVPVLDADWNELEDIRRVDHQLHLRFFIGNGIPTGSDGFRVGPVTADNDFAIDMGLALVEGWNVANVVAGLTYLGQTAITGLPVPALSPPLTGMRDDLIYLEVWEEETLAQSAPRADPRLIHPLIGLETCARIERRWLVQVAPNVTDPAAVVLPPGHVMLPLARARRVSGDQRIRANRIFDLRRTDINVAKYLKVPVNVERAGDLVDSTRLADLFEALRSIFATRLEANQLFVDTASDHDRAVVYFAVQHIAQVCATGALQARTNALTEADALAVMTTLAEAQEDFIDALSVHGNAGPATVAFVNDYRAHLDGSSSLDGVTPALGEDDLIGAFLGQQTLNAWLSAAVGTLPEGDVTVQYIDVTPLEDLVAGTPYTFTVQFISGVTSDEVSETFDVFATLSSDLWSIDVEQTEIDLDNSGGTGTLEFVVTPSAANATCVFEVTARARRNPAIQSTQPGLLLELGETPPIGSILLYAGPPLNADNRMELSAAQLTSGFGTAVAFTLNNSTDTQHTYTVQWWMTINTGPDTGWSPIDSARSQNNFTVPPESLGGASLAVAGPDGTDVTGVVGVLHATLLLIDGAAPAAGQAVTLEIEFIAV